MNIQKEADEYMKRPAVQAALKLMDREDIETHIHTAYYNGAYEALNNQWHYIDQEFPPKGVNIILLNTKCTEGEVTVIPITEKEEVIKAYISCRGYNKWMHIPRTDI